MQKYLYESAHSTLTAQGQAKNWFDKRKMSFPKTGMMHHDTHNHVYFFNINNGADTSRTDRPLKGGWLRAASKCRKVSSLYHRAAPMHCLEVLHTFDLWAEWAFIFDHKPSSMTTAKEKYTLFFFLFFVKYSYKSTTVKARGCNIKHPPPISDARPGWDAVNTRTRKQNS